ncbi:hypothetical protein DPMN_052423 [Dreissena polymorpha]|uniref:MADF domain-containing protein n=1 Tax=Dreissena polymorpha TaxID=45954 RepID=A0A9D4CKV9_DREPO|nr:hypothetical protein DPMN_052423 [Dreissena polymorpha]
MGPKRVAERPRSPTPPPAKDEEILVPEPEKPQPHPAGDHLPVITPVPAAAASKKRTYKPYYYATLTEAQIEEVIDWLKDTPSIYSKRLSDYKDTQNKEKIWVEKAADMGVERTIRKSGKGTETDKWVWERFSFLKDHIESVERRNVRTNGSHHSSHPLIDSQQRFMSDKKGGPSTFARHIDESLAQLPGDIKPATQIKLMEVLHEGQRQAEERHEMFQQMPTLPQQQQQPQRQSYLSSSTMAAFTITVNSPSVSGAPKTIIT